MRRALILAATTAIAIGGILAGLAASGAFDQNSNELSAAVLTANAIHTPPAAALTADAIQTMVNATRAALPQATVDPNYTPPQSCPSDFPKTGVFPYDPAHAPPFDFKGGITTKAFAVGSNGIGYSLAAGLIDRSDPRWFIRALPAYPDYCTVLTGHAPGVPTRYYEVAPGPVTLTQIDGDVIVFTKGDGNTGRLNYVTETLLTP